MAAPPSLSPRARHLAALKPRRGGVVSSTFHVSSRVPLFVFESTLRHIAASGQPNGVAATAPG